MAVCGKGDDGYTRVLGPDRLPKYHPRVEALGAVDSASAALGWARVNVIDVLTREALLEIQRDCYHVMAELAIVPGSASPCPTPLRGRVVWLERLMATLQRDTAVPKGFVVPGDSRGGAALDVARTAVRQAERTLARLVHEGEVVSPDVLPYLNRLSSLLFVLARYEDILSGVPSYTLARNEPSERLKV